MLNLNHELLQQQASISSVPVAVPVTTERYIDVIVPDGATAGNIYFIFHVFLHLLHTIDVSPTYRKYLF